MHAEALFVVPVLFVVPIKRVQNASGLDQLRRPIRANGDGMVRHEAGDGVGFARQLDFVRVDAVGRAVIFGDYIKHNNKSNASEKNEDVYEVLQCRHHDDVDVVYQLAQSLPMLNFLLLIFKIVHVVRIFLLFGLVRHF